MPAIGYAVAAAAGMIGTLVVTPSVPLIVPSPVLGTLGSLAGGVSVADERGSHERAGGSLPDAGQRGDERFDLGSGDVSALASNSASTGDVSLLVIGSDLLPRMWVVLSSPGLSAACEDDTLQGVAGRTDRAGHVDLTAAASGCVPGTYQISVSEITSPFRTFTTDVTVR